MRINAILTWFALVATWTWLAVTYIDARVARGEIEATFRRSTTVPAGTFENCIKTGCVVALPN